MRNILASTSRRLVQFFVLQFYSASLFEFGNEGIHFLHSFRQQLLLPKDLFIC